MPRILVAYATKTGTTKDVAETIADTLRKRGGQVAALRIDSISGPLEYDAVVIGSAIREANWLPEAVGFLEEYQDQLTKLPVATFTLSMTLSEGTEESREIVEGYLDSIRGTFPDIVPIAEAYFAGALYYSRLNLDDISTILETSKDGEPPFKDGDFRDWDAIRAWASGIYPIFDQA